MKYAACDIQDKDIQDAAAQIEYGDFSFISFITPKGQGSGSGLIDDSHHIQTRDPAGIR